MKAKSTKNVWPITLGVVSVAALTTFFYLNSPLSNGTNNHEARSITNTPLHSVDNVIMPEKETLHTAVIVEQSSEVDTFEALKKDLIKKILWEYEAVIGDIAVQVSLKDFLADLIQSYPVKGRTLFEEVIRGAFPELADDILKAVALMKVYDEWLLDNILALNDMNLLQHKGKLWKKREDLFGENAKKIWSEEITAEEDRRIAVQNTAELLDQAFDTTMNERIYILQSAFDEQYSETVENAVLDTRGVLAQTLFGFDSVQKELAVLSEDERQEQIDTIRRTIGFDEDQIVYLSEQDKVKESRWKNGYAYMEQRKILSDNLTGESFEEALAELRSEHFQHEAPTIAREEKDELFRYERPRIYGRN